jgi:hypothetical protein
MKQIALLVSSDNPFYRYFFVLQKHLNYNITAVVSDNYRSNALLYASENMVDHYTIEWHKGRESEEEYIKRANELVDTLEVDLLFATDWKHNSLTTKHPFYYVDIGKEIANFKNGEKEVIDKYVIKDDDIANNIYYYLCEKLFNLLSLILQKDVQ